MESQIIKAGNPESDQARHALDRYASLDAKNDPLAEINEIVPWEEFRPLLEQVWRKPDSQRQRTPKLRSHRRRQTGRSYTPTENLRSLVNNSG